MSEDGTRFLQDNNQFNNGYLVTTTVNGRQVQGEYWIRDTAAGTAQIAAYRYTLTDPDGSRRIIEPKPRQLSWYDGIQLSRDGYAAAYVQHIVPPASPRSFPRPEDASQSVIFFDAHTGASRPLPAAHPVLPTAPACRRAPRSVAEQCQRPLCGDGLRRS